MADNHYDVIIIGSGVGGGTVSTRNASAIMPPAVRSDDGVRRPPGWR